MCYAISLSLVTCLFICMTRGIVVEATLGQTDCPPWYYQDSEGKCSFIHEMIQIVHQYGNTSELEIGYCMTATNTSIVVAQCPYIPVGTNFHHMYHNIYQPLPMNLDNLNSAMCSPYNRRGYLCSECKEDHGLAAFRYYGLECVPCSNTILSLIAYLALLFIPPTIVFFLVILLRVDLNHGNMVGLIHFSHIVTTTFFFYPQLIILLQTLFGYWTIQILVAVYGVWSLNTLQFLIQPFCVSHHLSILQLICLGYIPSVYPLLLCVLTYWLIELHGRHNRLVVKLWSPFKKIFRAHSVHEFAVVKTFATFIFLCYGTNLFVSFTLLQGSVLFELNMDTNTISVPRPHSVDLSKEYFSPAHVPYAVIGIVGGLVTVIFPLLLALIFPTRLFPVLIKCCGRRRWLALRTFMEVFSGCYKDGTEEHGSRDYRPFVSAYLLGRLFHSLTWHSNGALFQVYSWPIAAVVLYTSASVMAFFKPHRKLVHTVIDTLLLLTLGTASIFLHVIFETNVRDDTLYGVGVMLVTIAVVPHVILFIFLSYKLLYWIHSLLCNMMNRKQSSDSVLERGGEQERQPLLITCNT